ncbi:MAG: dihydroneopterin aldolase [Kiritimatiellae bacterium]|nr:dihydroneopterin aldolase [Kiritimatiellia bacterium]
MRLRLEGLDVDCVIGDRPDERDRQQRLRVDVELAVADAAAESDRLCDAVDYAALACSIRAALVDAKCRLIERAAKVVRDVCLADPRVAAARVSVAKAGAVPHLASASAVLGDL